MEWVFGDLKKLNKRQVFVMLQDFTVLVSSIPLPVVLPGAQFRNDCLFSSYDMEGINGRNW